VLRNNLKITILLAQNNYASSGTVLQDTVVWKSRNGQINKETQLLGKERPLGGVHKSSRVRTTLCFAVVETKRVPLE